MRVCERVNVRARERDRERARARAGACEKKPIGGGRAKRGSVGNNVNV